MLEHLDELRRRVIKATVAYALAYGLCWSFYDRILMILTTPLRRLPNYEQFLTERGQLIVTSVPDAFLVRVKTVAVVAMFVASPVALWQLWRFITPALHRRERTWSVAFVTVSVLLFAAGGMLAAASLPAALRFLASFAGTQVQILPRASDYIGFTLFLGVAFGLAFEIPVLLMFLSLIGVVTPKGLSRARRPAWVALMILAAFITPTQDPVTMMMMAVPLIVLYEVTILTSTIVLKRRSKDLADSTNADDRVK